VEDRDWELASFWYEKYCRCDDFDRERYEQLLLDQFRPLLRGLVFRVKGGIGWLFPAHDTQDYFVLCELAFVLAARALKGAGVGSREFVGCLPTHCLFQFLKLLRSEFEFASSAVWSPMLRGGEPLRGVLAIVCAGKIEALLAPDPDADDDEPRDELWLASMHRDLDPQCALELRELAQEIWSGLCAGELRVPERWQGADELLAFLNECGLQISETDYKRMLKRNKARRWRESKSKQGA